MVLPSSKLLFTYQQLCSDPLFFGQVWNYSEKLRTGWDSQIVRSKKGKERVNKNMRTTILIRSAHQFSQFKMNVYGRIFFNILDIYFLVCLSLIKSYKMLNGGVFWIKKDSEVSVATKLILCTSALFYQRSFNRCLQPFFVLDNCVPYPLEDQTIID